LKSIPLAGNAIPAPTSMLGGLLGSLSSLGGVFGGSPAKPNASWKGPPTNEGSDSQKEVGDTKQEGPPIKPTEFQRRVSSFPEPSEGSLDDSGGRAGTPKAAGVSTAAGDAGDEQILLQGSFTQYLQFSHTGSPGNRVASGNELNQAESVSQSAHAAQRPETRPDPSSGTKSGRQQREQQREQQRGGGEKEWLQDWLAAHAVTSPTPQACQDGRGREKGADTAETRWGISGDNGTGIASGTLVGLGPDSVTSIRTDTVTQIGTERGFGENMGLVTGIGIMVTAQSSRWRGIKRHFVAVSQVRDARIRANLKPLELACSLSPHAVCIVRCYQLYSMFYIVR